MSYKKTPDMYEQISKIFVVMVALILPFELILLGFYIAKNDPANAIVSGIIALAYFGFALALLAQSKRNSWVEGFKKGADTGKEFLDNMIAQKGKEVADMLGGILGHDHKKHKNDLDDALYQVLEDLNFHEDGPKTSEDHKKIEDEFTKRTDHYVKFLPDATNEGEYNVVIGPKPISDEQITEVEKQVADHDAKEDAAKKAEVDAATKAPKNGKVTDTVKNSRKK